MNTQVGSISGLAGKGGGATLDNTTTSTVAASGDANAHTGDVPAGATVGSAPASALGATTTNTVTDKSVVSVTVGGENQAPITVTNQNTRNVQDSGSASANSGAAGTSAPAVTAAASSPVTTSNAVPAVTATPVTGAAAASASPSPAILAKASASPAAASASPAAASGSPAVTTSAVTPVAATAPASCTGHTAETTITGSAEKKVSGPAASGQPIDIGIAQRASATNTGSTTGVLSLAGPAAGPAPAASGTGGGANGATAKGLSATNTVENTALVDVAIGGSNYAPINVAVRTVTTIVNAAKAVVETAAGGGPASGAGAAGVGAKATNKISLDGTAAVDIAGDNHTPIRIVLDIGAELWNKGAALLGLSQGTGGPATASATGLEVENLLKLLGRASVRIGGSNYAPIDIDILLQNLIYNDGIANAGSAGGAASDAAARTADVVRDVSSGPAACTSLLSTAGVVNGQVATVKMAEDKVRRQVLAGNTHVVDVQGYGTARCSTGDVTGAGGHASSGPVTVNGGGTTLAVVTTQLADTSEKTDPAPAPATPVEVVVAVTTTPVHVPGKTAGGRGNIQNSVIQEDGDEWVVVWEPLYVIYPSNGHSEAAVLATDQSAETSDTETTTSMAGSFHRPDQVVTPTVYVVGGMDLLSQIQIALLGLLGFLLLALLKRRLKAAEARKALLLAPELVVLQGGAEAAAE